MTADRKTIGVWMIVASFVVALGAILLWQQATTNANESTGTEQMAAVMAGRPAEDVEANRTPPLVAAGVAAVGFLGGVILVASPTDKPSQ